MKADEISHGAYLGHSGQLIFMERIVAGRVQWRSVHSLRSGALRHNGRKPGINSTSAERFAAMVAQRLPNSIADQLRKVITNAR